MRMFTDILPETKQAVGQCRKKTITRKCISRENILGGKKLDFYQKNKS